MWRWINSNHNGLTALGAIVIGAVALFVAWDQARVMRAQQHADVWPALQLESTYLVDDRVHRLIIGVVNDGIGPALVESVTAEFAGAPMASWEDFARRLPDGLERPDMFTSSVRGEILAPGEELPLAELSWDYTRTSTDPFNAFRDDFWAMRASICYCSVYEQCWTAELRADSPRPKRVRRCPAPDPGSNL